MPVKYNMFVKSFYHGHALGVDVRDDAIFLNSLAGIALESESHCNNLGKE